MWVGTRLLHLRGCCILEKLEASRTPAVSCCVRPLGPHAADASDRECLPDEGLADCVWRKKQSLCVLGLSVQPEGRHGVVVWPMMWDGSWSAVPVMRSSSAACSGDFILTGSSRPLVQLWRLGEGEVLHHGTLKVTAAPSCLECAQDKNQAPSILGGLGSSLGDGGVQSPDLIV